MRRTAGIAVVVGMLALAACAPADDGTPMTRCIDANVEYGLVADREEGADLCQWIKERENLLDAPFDETFASSDSAALWAESELAKN